MNDAQIASQVDFQEVMITTALEKHLGKQPPDAQRMRWVFSLKARTKGVSKPLSDLCGFTWEAGETGGGHQEGFVWRIDAGAIPEDDFKKRFWMKTPDFRYWTERKRDKQLIVEAKGTVKPLKKDKEQATRYFSYLQQFPCRGAVVYFVPNPDNWLEWLEEIAIGTVKSESQINWGIVGMEQIVPNVASELIRVVGEALVQTADHLERALKVKPAE